MVMNKDFKYPDKAAYEWVVRTLESKGVTAKKIAEIVYELQRNYLPNKTVDDFTVEVKKVMHKRELLNNAMCALWLDQTAEMGIMPSPLREIVRADDGVFGSDEALASGIASLWGTIGFTNYGYVDKTKPGIIGQLDTTPTQVNTFIDDIVGAIVAAVCGKMAHATA